MKIKYSSVARAILFSVLAGLAFERASAGSLEPPAGPDSAESAMWTLQDLYDVLDTRWTNVVKRGTDFAEPAEAPSSGTMRTLNEIMGLVTSRVSVAKTGQTVVRSTGDDGYHSIGIPLPRPRFTIGTNAPGQPNDTNCVTDNLTGLMWARNANIPEGEMTWLDAVQYCATNLNIAGYGGYDDWRLPNANELLSLYHFGYYEPALSNTEGDGPWEENDPFTGVEDIYWSSSDVIGAAVNRCAVRFYDDFITREMDNTTPNHIWPVRGGGQ